MITLKISFLLAIKLKEVAPIPTHKPGKKGKKEKRGKSKSKIGSKSKTKTKTKPKLKSKSKNKSKSGKSKKSQNMKEKKEDGEDETYAVIAVENPISYVHIDYDLFGKKFKYGVDVVCWESVAKIFTKHGTKCLKTVVRDEVVWVPVFLEHYLNPLTTEDIRKLLQQEIRLEVNIGQSYVGKKAHSDKTSVFYLRKDDANNEYFPEVLLKKPKSNEEQMDLIWKKLLTFPINREIVTWMYNMDNVHAHKIAKIVTKRSLGQEIHCKDFCDDGKTKGGKPDKKGKKKRGKSGSKKSKSSKKSKKGKTSKKGNKSKSKSGKKNAKEVSAKLDFKIPAHVFLSDPELALYQVKNTGTRLDELYILLSSDNILTTDQKLELSPLLVKIRKINNLPEDYLKAKGFKNVYVSCDVPGITQFKTSFRPIGNTLHFDESRFIITSDYPWINILEILETRRVTTKIIGVKEQPQSHKSGKKKGKKKTKKDKKSKKSKKSKSSKSSTDRGSVVTSFDLTGATFDLSSLASTFFLFKEKGQCYTLESLPSQTRLAAECFFMDRYTMNEVNFNNMDRVVSDSPLSGPVMLFNGTTVKFEARFLIPVFPLYYVKDVGGTYKRLLVILSKKEVAKLFLGAIMLYNHRILGGAPLLIPNFLMKKRTGLIAFDRCNDLISGFSIDDGTSVITYVEGPSNGYILHLVHQITSMNYSTARIFYNSDYIFKERLYANFHKNSGMYVMTLKLPLVDIFAEQKLYVEGNAPLHCFKAIQKLNLILNSSTFKSILSFELLPTEVELLSFAVEYGFQIWYKGPEIDLNESVWWKSNTDLFGGLPLK